MTAAPARTAAALITIAAAITTLTGQASSAAPVAAGSMAAGNTTAASGPRCPGQSRDDTPVSAGDFAKVNGVVPRPVVLVHGWNSSYKAMQGYARLLDTSKVLHDPLRAFLFDYSGNSGRWAAIPAIAACLGAYVNKISADYRNAGGDGKVLAVGHSMGGLAIRFSSSARYAAQPDGAVLGGVVTIDTPHLGSPWGDTRQAQLLQDYAQLKAGNWLEGMFPWPIGSDGQTCLVTHVGTTGMPLGCPTPSWLPADVPVAEIGGDITVQRQIMGYTIDTADTGGDSVVATTSSLGYQPSSGPGSPPAPVAAPATYTDRCQVTTGQVEAGIGGYGISLLRGLESGVLALFSRPAGTSFWNSPLTQPVATFLSLANKTARCAHTNINNPATDPFAALDVLKALNVDIDRLSARPTVASLLKASGMPHATAPIAVPSGWEAAAWDNHGGITFWKAASGTTSWRLLGASSYPVLRMEPIGATITGELLNNMSDATFIARGGFSGDGTGSAIAFTNGPHGWGTITPVSQADSSTLIPTGKKAPYNSYGPGTSYAEFFTNGDLDRVMPGSLPFGPNGEEWEVVRGYTWSGGAFRQARTSQFTAAPATPLPGSTAPFPAQSCQGTQNGTFKDFAVTATTTFTGPVQPAYLPTAVRLHIQGDGTSPGCDFTVAPDFSVVISAQTASGPTWITAPAWALTRQSQYGSPDIGNLLSGLQLPGQSGLNSIFFQDPVNSPYYIPKSLGITQVGPLESPVVSIRGGKLVALTVLPTT